MDYIVGLDYIEGCSADKGCLDRRAVEYIVAVDTAEGIVVEGIAELVGQQLARLQLQGLRRVQQRVECC